MKLERLLAALVSTLALSLQAQTIQLTLCPGYNLIANPLNRSNNNIQVVIPVAPEGSVVYRWHVTNQMFVVQSPEYYAVYYGGVWYDGNFAISSMVLSPGEGFFFENDSRASTTLTFMGEIPHGTLTNRIGANYSFVSSQVPQSARCRCWDFRPRME